MESTKQLLFIIPLFVVIVWQWVSLKLECDSLDNRMRFNSKIMLVKYEWRNSKVSYVDPLLGLHMIIVSLRSGVAITRALSAVGEVFPCGQGMWLCSVSNALLAGDTWHEAWSSTYTKQDNFELENKSKFTNRKNLDSSEILARWLMTSLKESWCYGSSPVPVLSALAQHYEINMANIARQESSKLSVRLLLPVGLCFLPSFICIGILPIVMSLMR